MAFKKIELGDSGEKFFFYALELEKQHKKSLPRYTDRELLEIFPEVKKIIPKKISEWQKKYDRLEKDIEDLLTAIQERCPQDAWFWEKVAEKLLVPDLLKIEGQIMRLKRIYSITKNKNRDAKNSYENFQEKIELARTYPIYELARDKLDLKPRGKNFVALCPLHNEKTPSFYLFTQTNTFVCFGCGEKGDVISLTQQLYGVDFKKAVELLQIK